MQWLKRIVRRWVEHDESMMASNQVGLVERKQPYSEEYMTNETIRFQLTPAVGGRILRVTRDGGQNMKTLGGSSEYNNQLYVIPTGDDIGARVAKICNLELLK